MKENLLGLALVLLFSCSSEQNENNRIESDDQIIQDSSSVAANVRIVPGDIEFRLFRTDTVLKDQTNGWGYDIYIDQKRMIHQPHVPAISGNLTFQTKEMAELVAQLVVFKLANNINPPSVSIQELDSLGFE